MDFNSISTLWQNWTADKWTTVEVHQRMREGDFKNCFHTDGAAGGSNTKVFKFLKEEGTNNLLQPDNNVNTVLKVMAVSVALAYSWRVPGLGFSVPGLVIPLTFLGNLGLGIAQGIESLKNNWGTDIKSQLPTSERVWKNLIPIMKAGTACLALNMYQSLASEWITTIAVYGWAGYILYNPRGAALWVNSAESLVGATPNPEYHATARKNSDVAENWHDYAEGRIPVTCLLNMHSPGNLDERVDNRDYVFEATDKKTQ